ncbi:MAG: hypothetical protein E6I92_08550 [Chloroflexi bacterium]|nr:MAG: hypothetical protein E6I92_08550 [Chloroflexota bacterium]
MRSAAAATRQRRQLTRKARARNRTPLTAKSEDVSGSVWRWGGISARWIAPVTSNSTAAPRTVPATFVHPGCRGRTTSATGAATRPASKPMAWSGLTSNIEAQPGPAA